LYLTGVHGLAGSTFTIRIGSATISGALVTSNAVLVEPGVYAVDFTLPATLNRAGDQPVIVSVTIGGVTYTSRLDDTAPRTSIL
jgi:putative intracellular protease/amidase